MFEPNPFPIHPIPLALMRKFTLLTILDIFENAASVKVIARDWIDYLHVGKYNGEWRIVNVLWELNYPRASPGASCFFLNRADIRKCLRLTLSPQAFISHENVRVVPTLRILKTCFVNR